MSPVSSTCKMAARNRAVNLTLVKCECAVSLTLIALVISMSGSIAIGLFLALIPALTFFFHNFRSICHSLRGSNDPVRGLPNDIGEIIRSVVDVPKNTFFLRGPEGHCRAFSMIFFHVIILPPKFENRLTLKKNCAILLHEFSHNKYFDYMFILWTWLCALFYILLIYEYYFKVGFEQNLYALFYKSGEKVPDIFQHVPTDTGDILIHIPLFVFALMCAITSMNIIHNRESHADIIAFSADNDLYQDYLKRNIYYEEHSGTRDIMHWVTNWFFHPSFKNRLDILTGAKQVASYKIFLSSFVLGFCPLLLLFPFLSGFGSLVRLEIVSEYVFSLIVSIVALKFYILTFREISSKNLKKGDTSIFYCGFFTGMLIFWYSMIIGYYAVYDNASLLIDWEDVFRGGIAATIIYAWVLALFFLYKNFSLKWGRTNDAVGLIVFILPIFGLFLFFPLLVAYEIEVYLYALISIPIFPLSVAVVLLIEWLVLFVLKLSNSFRKIEQA